MLSRSSRVLFKKLVLKNKSTRCIKRYTRESIQKTRLYCTSFDDAQEIKTFYSDKPNYSESMERVLIGSTYFSHNVYNARKKSITDSYRPGKVMLDKSNANNNPYAGAIISFKYGTEIRTGHIVGPKSHNLWNVVKNDGKDIVIKESDIIFQWPIPELSNEFNNTKLNFTFPYKNCNLHKARSAVYKAKDLLAQIHRNMPSVIWQFFYPFCVSGSRFSVPLDYYSVAMALFGDKDLTDIHVFAAFELLRSYPDKFIYHDDGFYCNRLFLVRSASYDFPLQRLTEQFIRTIENSLIEGKTYEGLYYYIKMVGKIDTSKIVNQILTEYDPNLKINSHDLFSFRLLTDYALLRKTHKDHSQIYEDILKPLGYEKDPQHAYDLLLKLGIFKEHENPHYLRWDHDLTFNELIAADVLSAMKKDDKENDRVDLTNHHVYSITKFSNDIIENGISIVTDENNNQWIYFHISDVTYYVYPNSRLEREARRRVMKIGLPEIEHNIFPQELTEFLGFKPGAKNKAVSIGVLLNEDGSVKEFKAVKSHIEKIHRLTIDELDDILETDDSKLNPKLSQFKRFHNQMIEKLSSYASKRREYRLNNNAILADTPSPDVRVIYNEDGSSHTSIKPKKEKFKGANGILAEFELLVGEVVATLCYNKNIPIIYESQEYLSNEQKNNTNNPESETYYSSYINSLDKLKTKVISADPTKHEVYGLSKYTNVSSPITNYFDCFIQYQLKCAIEHKRPVFSKVYIESMIPKSQPMEKDIKELISNVNRFNVIKKLEEMYYENPNRKYNFVITHHKSVFRPEPTGILTDFGLITNIRSKRVLNRGDSIEVVIKSVNRFYDKLILEDIELQDHNNNQ